MYSRTDNRLIPDLLRYRWFIRTSHRQPSESPKDDSINRQKNAFFFSLSRKHPLHDNRNPSIGRRTRQRSRHPGKEQPHELLRACIAPIHIQYNYPTTIIAHQNHVEMSSLSRIGDNDNILSGIAIDVTHCLTYANGTLSQAM